MKKADKKKLSLEKFSISKLNGMSKIFGGNNRGTGGGGDGDTIIVAHSTRYCKDMPGGQ